MVEAARVADRAALGVPAPQRGGHRAAVGADSRGGGGGLRGRRGLVWRGLVWCGDTQPRPGEAAVGGHGGGGGGGRGGEERGGVLVPGGGGGAHQGRVEAGGGRVQGRVEGVVGAVVLGQRHQLRGRYLLVLVRGGYTGAGVGGGDCGCCRARGAAARVTGLLLLQPLVPVRVVILQHGARPAAHSEVTTHLVSATHLTAAAVLPRLLTT